MELFESRFSDEFLRRAARSIRVKRGGWGDLFLERVETLRVEIDSRGDLLLIPSRREGFAVRSVTGDSQRHHAAEGLDEERILAACRSEERDAAGDPPGGAGTDPCDELDIPGIRSRLQDAAGIFAKRLSGSPAFQIVFGILRRSVRIAVRGGSVRSEERRRAVLTARLREQGEELAVGRGSEDPSTILDPATAEALAEEAERFRAETGELRPAPEGEEVVVLAPGTGGVFLHEACGHALEADLVLRGGSALGGLRGERVAPPFVSVVDDPSHPGLEGSYAFDDEGTRARATVLIEAGVLKSFLADRISGGRLGSGSTGNGRRESFLDLPSSRMSNTFLRAGEEDPDAIVRSTRRGVFVQRLEGGRADPASGEFVFRAGSGRLIESGRLTAPLAPFRIAGNGARALRELDRVGRDLSFGSGAGSCGKGGQVVPVAVGQPTIRVRSLMVHPGW
jgi:predicted Zn-dependent protease